MFGLTGAAVRQKCRAVLNPVIGEQVWTVNKEAALEKAKAVWLAMSQKQQYDSDFSGGSTSVYGQVLTAAQKLADKANEEHAVLVDSPLVHRIQERNRHSHGPVDPEQAHRGLSR